MRIGVFDSGIGGLTVLKTLINKYPCHEYIYCGDTKNIPYGEKSIDELKQLSSNIINFLISKNVNIIIIACGTVSSNIYSYLKDKYSVPIYDIISPTINYINNCNYTNIGVIGTKRTIESKVFSNTNKNIKEASCPKFVPIIESNDISKIDDCLEEYLNNLKDCDLIVLGCTHYPLIKNNLNKYFNDKVKLLNMADCLPKVDLVETHKNIELYFSKLDYITKNNIDKIIKYNYIEEIQFNK